LSFPFINPLLAFYSKEKVHCWPLEGKTASDRFNVLFVEELSTARKGVTQLTTITATNEMAKEFPNGFILHFHPLFLLL
jgi:hypothetical protein